MTDTYRLLTTLAMVKGLRDSCTLPKSGFVSYPEPEHLPFISPFHALHGDFTSLHDQCPTQTIELITEMHDLTQAFLNPVIDPATTAKHHQTYTRLLNTPPPPPSSNDPVYQAIHLTSLIYTHSLLNHTLFHLSSTGLAQTTHPHTTTLTQLLTTLSQTNTATCWGPLRGIFLWICLIGGAASWGAGTPGQSACPQLAWARKCFSMWAVKAVVMGGFEEAKGVMRGLEVGVRVRMELNGEGRGR